MSGTSTPHTGTWQRQVKAGRFRLDLFYRLNIFTITVPALRERKEDLLELTAHLVKKYSKIYKREMTFTPEGIIDKLVSYDWPGNVRELENVIQRAILMSKTNTVNNENLTFDMPEEYEQADSLLTVVRNFNGTPLKGIVGQAEKEVIVHKPGKNWGNVAKTAAKLEIN